MKILITGGAGFIGAWLGKSLHEGGDEVIAVDDFSSINYPTAIKEARARELLEGIRIERLSILDYEKLLKLFHEVKPRIIIHLAAAPGVRYSSKQPLTYARVNVEGTTSVFEAARQEEIPRIIYASSSSVYGRNIKVPFAEDDRTDMPSSIYAATKTAAELIAEVYTWRMGGMSTTGIRFFNVYGPWGRPDTVPYIFTDAVSNNRPIHLFGEGQVLRDYTYIDDIIDGIIKIMNRPGIPKIYNLGNSTPHHTEKLLQIIEESLGKFPSITHESLPPEDVKVTHADISKAKKELGWVPKVSLEAGMKKFIEWYLEFHKPEFIRYEY